MFTPRIISLSEDFITWLSIWSNNLPTSSFIKSFGSMAIIWKLLGFAFNRFTFYHCVTFSVSLFSSWTSVLIESQSCIFDGRLRTWKHCFGIDSVIKVQRKNPVGFRWFVPFTHFAGLAVLLGFFEAFKKDLRTSPKTACCKLLNPQSKMQQVKRCAHMSG